MLDKRRVCTNGNKNKQKNSLRVLINTDKCGVRLRRDKKKTLRVRINAGSKEYFYLCVCAQLRTIKGYFWLKSLAMRRVHWRRDKNKNSAHAHNKSQQLLTLVWDIPR